MKFGVIGYGSIGKRHVQNLISLGQDDIVLLREIGSGNQHGFSEVKNMTELMSRNPDAVILANPTSMHASYLAKILAQDLHLLAEKPLVSSDSDLEMLEKSLSSYHGVGMTAYNMRFHPCVLEAQRIISEKMLGSIFSARFFVGQYLPSWRPHEDYSQSYSAKISMGGGVLFDLIHEIDLACFLVGKPEGQINAMAEKISDLKINSEDLAEILYQTSEKSMVSIHLDYLTQGYKRYIEIVGSQANLYADLYTNQVLVTSSEGVIHSQSYPEFSKNDMYVNMLKDFIDGTIDGTIDGGLVEPSLKTGIISNQIAIEIRKRLLL